MPKQQPKFPKCEWKTFRQSCDLFFQLSQPELFLFYLFSFVVPISNYEEYPHHQD